MVWSLSMIETFDKEEQKIVHELQNKWLHSYYNRLWIKINIEKAINLIKLLCSETPK